MQTKFSPEQTIHVWAQLSQPRGEERKGPSVYFYGPVLYSYGRHYPMGVILPDGFALINDDSNSVTTNRHRHIAWQAVSHRRRAWLPDMAEIFGNNEAPARVLEGDSREWAKDAARAKVLAYLETHASTIPLEATAALLRFVGVTRGDVERAERLAKKDAARIKREAAEAEAKRKAEHLAEASTLAKLTESEVAARLVEANSGRYPARAEDVSDTAGLEQFGKRLHHVHKYAKAAGREKQAARVWAILGAVRAEIKRRKALAERYCTTGNTWSAAGRTRHQLRRLIMTFRERARSYRDGTSTTAGVEQWAGAISSLLASPKIGKRLAVSLNATLGEVQTLINELHAESLEAWRNGMKSNPPRSQSDDGGVYLRAIRVTRDNTGAICAGDLQTSQGAEVPLVHALRVFRFLKLCRAKGEAWRTNGRTIRVGHFRVDEVQPDGSFRAGCHFIPWREVEALALRLGVADIAADESAVTESEAAH